MPEKAYSVSQINRYIKNMFSRDFMLHLLTVTGEVSNCKVHEPTGHIYFTLKDKNSALPCVMWAGNRRTGLSFPLQNGQEVFVRGNIDVFERDGRYQLYAQQITLAGTGALYARFEALKAELEERGMFAPEYKRPLPQYIRCLGVVTAATGAAVRDIVSIAKRRFPYIRILLYSAIVQGPDAPASIIRGIRTLEKTDAEVIIVGRGGGSIEDLWGFNDEHVAQAIFDCKKPVISAVGHETDFTIADFVADLRAPTPSAAAELAVFDYRVFCESLDLKKQHLRRRMSNLTRNARMETKIRKGKLRLFSPAHRLQALRIKNRMYRMTLTETMGFALQRYRHLQWEKRDDLIRLMLQGNAHARAEVLRRDTRLRAKMEQQLTGSRQQLALAAGRLEGVSPLKRLRAGYGYVTDGAGKRLTSVSGTGQGEELRIYLTDGRIDAAVRDTERIDWESLAGENNEGKQ